MELVHDNHESKEKIFLPLESEIYGEINYSLDTSILEKYPQWFMFKKRADSKIKYYRQNGEDREVIWLNANKAGTGCYCANFWDGVPIVVKSNRDDAIAIPIAFCI